MVAEEESSEESMSEDSNDGDEGPSSEEADLDPTSREAAALNRARRVSRLLDDAIRVPGTDFRIGLDPILGVVPGAGDTVAAAISLYPIVVAYRFDVPRRTLAKMLLLISVDAIVGSVPVFGPVFDAFWKANEWNVRSFERHLKRS